MENLGQKVTAGIYWMVGARLVDRLIGIISTLILARVLVPGDFGLVAMATAIGGILDLLGAFSFDMALIQNAKAERRHYDTVWTFNVLFGLTCGLGLIMLANFAAKFYSEPRLTMIMYVLSLSYFLNAFNNIGVIAFRKDLNFGKEFKFMFWRRFATFIITISAAFVLRSYWALLIGMTFGRLVGLVMSYAMNSYRPWFTLSALPELFGFSKWLLINNALFFLLHNGCTFVIGRMFGAGALGIYSVSYEISSLPSSELVAPINRVMFPSFSKMKATEEIARAYLKLFGLITLTILPVGIGIAAVAEPLVLTVLGNKWIAAIPLIQLLALHGAVSATQTNNGVVWLALGRPRATTSIALYFLAVLFPALYLGLKWYGLPGVGYAYMLANILTIPYGMHLSKTFLGFSWSALFACFWRPVLGVVLMYVAVRLFDHQMAGQLPLLRTLADAAVGALVYCAFILVTWRSAGRPDSAERFVLNKVPFVRSLAL
jgi:O-antigen/teichoic acid export membrane protein